jgi:hypothetical protein
MPDPVLLTASYMKTHFDTTSYGGVVWSALKNPPANPAGTTTGGVTAYNSSVTKAQAKGVSIYANRAAFPATGVVGKVYVARDTSAYYRWVLASSAEGVRLGLGSNSYVVRDTRASYINGSRHADWLRDFYDRSSRYSA